MLDRSQWKSPPPALAKPSFMFCNSLRTLKFSLVQMRAVNPEGSHVPLIMLSSLHPKHRTQLLNIRSHAVDICEGLTPQAISSWGWHQNKIFIGLCRAFTCTPSLTHVPDHPSICGTAEWPSQTPSLWGKWRGCRLDFQESAVSMTF